MKSLAVDASLFNRLTTSNAYTEIISKNDVPSLQAASSKNDSSLQAIIEALPEIVAEVPSANFLSPIQRRNFADRIDVINSQVEDFNKSIDETGWITFLHVILCILTLGIFQLRSQFYIQKVEVALKELFPESSPLASHLTVEEYLSLAKKRRDEELQAMLALDPKEDSLLRIPGIVGTKSVQAVLEELLTHSALPTSHPLPPNSSTSSSSTSAPLLSRPRESIKEEIQTTLATEPENKGEKIRKLVQLDREYLLASILKPDAEDSTIRESIGSYLSKQSTTDILETFGLKEANWETGKNDKKWEATEGDPDESSHWIYLLTEEQCKTLPKDAFLLLSPHLTRSLHLSHETWKTIYLRHDPTLSLIQFFKTNIPYLATYLFPIYPESEIAESKKVVAKIDLKILEVFLLNIASPKGRRVAGYIARLLSPEQISLLSTQAFQNGASHLFVLGESSALFIAQPFPLKPQAGDPNLTAWLSKLIEQGKNKEVLEIVKGIGYSYTKSFAEKTPSPFLWKLLSCIVPQDVATTKHFCEWMSESKWVEMLKEKDDATLCLLLKAGATGPDGIIPLELLTTPRENVSDNVLKAATPYLCEKMSRFGDDTYPFLRNWILELIKIDAKKELLLFAGQFDTVLGHPLLKTSSPPFLWNLFGYLANNAPTAAQKVCSRVDEDEWRAMLQQLNEEALLALFKAGVPGPAKLFSPDEIKTSLPASVIKAGAKYACSNLSRLYESAYPQLGAWIVRLIKEDSKEEISAIMKQFQGFNSSYNFKFLSAGKSVFIWYFLSYATKIDPENEELKKSLRGMCNTIPKEKWIEMLKTANQETIIALFKAGAMGEEAILPKLLSVEQIGALSDEAAKAGAKHACGKIEYIDKENYAQLQAWIVKLMSIKASDALIPIVKQFAGISLASNLPFLSQANTNFVWSFLSYIVTNGLIANPQLKDGIQRICSIIEEKKWTEMLKTPKNDELFSLFEKGFFAKVFNIIPFANHLSSQELPQDALRLKALAKACDEYKSPFFYDEQKKALDSLKTKCLTKLDSLPK